MSLLACGSAAASSRDVEHTPWDELMERYVADRTVSYVGIAREQPALERYLASLAKTDPAQLPSNRARLAFWINAYNACVIQGVLDHQPIASVKDVKGFFDRLRYRVAGRDLTLNEIEHEGRALGDWRIHFGVVCASKGCPPIRSEAYAAEWLEAQLTDQLKAFLKNSRDGLRVEGSTLFVSSIFKWYAKDFVQGKLTAEALVDVLEPYLDRPVVEAVRGKRLALKFLPYDWSLNAMGRR